MAQVQHLPAVPGVAIFLAWLGVAGLFGTPAHADEPKPPAVPPPLKKEAKPQKPAEQDLQALRLANEQLQARNQTLTQMLANQQADADRAAQAIKQLTDQLKELQQKLVGQDEEKQALVKTLDELRLALTKANNESQRRTELLQQAEKAQAVQRQEAAQLFEKNQATLQRTEQLLQELLKLGVDNKKEVLERLAVEQARTEVLNTRLRELEAQLAKKAQQAVDPKQVEPSNTKGQVSNPPAAFVKGVIDTIDKTDQTLVQISIGSDAGLKTGHTLEVYRLQPQPEYLGSIRILETTPHRAVARWLPLGRASTVQLRVGDEVASQIPPR